jgi:hypothetical protein
MDESSFEFLSRGPIEYEHFYLVIGDIQFPRLCFKTNTKYYNVWTGFSVITKIQYKYMNTKVMFQREMYATTLHYA